MQRRPLLAAPALLLPAAPRPVPAQQGAGPQGRPLVIGAAVAPTGLDPHFHSTNANTGLLMQVFDALVTTRTDGALAPRLARSWRVLDDLTWEFRLRAGVRFHDGTPLTPEDIAFSFARVPTVPNSPGPFTPLVRAIRRVEVVDDLTLHLHTAAPTPFLARDLASVLILSRRLHAQASLADFNQGRAMIGTGAYRFVAHSQGERLELERNPDFWGEPPPWPRVAIRFIPNPAARSAALLAGELDLIDNVPPQDIARLSADPRIALFGVESLTTSYLMPDAVREPAPHLADRQGQPLARNPLRDRRVRAALSLAIPREAMVERLLHGQGLPAHQFAAPAAPDRDPALPDIPHDPEAARRLLREAGWGEGFRLTLHGPTGWIPGDAELLQALAQAWARIGVETRVEVMPPAPFFSRATAREFALFFATFTSATAAHQLRQVAMTRDAATGAGAFNRQHYANPALDAPLAEALGSMEEARRTALTRQARRVAAADLPVIPIHHPRNNWAGLRQRLRYDPSPLFYTNALLASPAA